MTEKTLTTENIKPALDALRGELAPWPVVAKKQDRLNTAQLNAANSGITSSLVAQIIANTAAIRALESAITGTGLRALVVATLPAVGTTGILYIVPVTTYDPETDADVVNYSNEYIWIPVEAGTASEGYYEQVGQTGIVINNGQLTITVNGTSVGTFTANQSGDTTAAITVPTNADYVDRTTDQTVAGVKTFSSTINGTASKAIADEDGTNIKSGYVNVAGNQTVTGNKKFTGSNTFNGIKSTGVIRVEKSTGDTEFEIVNGEVDATTNTLSRQDDIRFYDKNTKITGGLRLTYTTDTGTKIELYARSWKADGTASYNRSLTIYTNGQTGEYYTTLETNFLPKNTSVYSLGSSSYQWASVYAQTYYYNGTAWGLDKANKWTASNTYSAGNAIVIQNNYVSRGSEPSAYQEQQLKWSDVNGNEIARIRYVNQLTSAGNVANGLEFSTTDKFKDGVRDPTGSILSTVLRIGLWNDGTKYIYNEGRWRSNILPFANNSSSLGSSSYQWSSVYAQSYYYNGTQWGLDKANEWSGTNTYTKTVTLYNSDDTQSVPALYLRNSKAELSSSGNTSSYQDISFRDKNDTNYAYIRSGIQSNGSIINLKTFAKDSNNNSVENTLQIISFINGTKALLPVDSGTDLGNSNYKWKTLNGINPGALSLPINANRASFNIDTTNWTTDGSIIAYTPLLDGWIYINARNDDTNGDSFIIFDDGVSGFGTSVFGNKGLPNNGVGLLCLMMPVNKNNGINIRIKSPGIISARLYPCNGNV